MMLPELRRWIHSHAHVVMSFVIGIAFGGFIVALAYFSTEGGVASRVLLHGMRATGHADLDEDLIWFVGGIAVGGGIASYAWWRDGKARAAGLPKEDVLHRIASRPRLRIIAGTERSDTAPED